MFTRRLSLSLIAWLTLPATACELCAIYNADSASGKSGSGFSLAISEQYIPYRTVQLNSEELPPSILDDLFLERSMTHVVPTWSFSDRFSLSASLPIIHQRFKRYQLRPSSIDLESGEETGIGDLALIGRWTVFQKRKMTSAIFVNLLAGVKFPTGDADHLREEVDITRQLDAIYGIGHQHAVSGVHLRDLAFGSGSYDGIFGVTTNVRWQRLFMNGQFQYYLRTPGESGYQFGNEWMLTGGPGVFVLLD